MSTTTSPEALRKLLDNMQTDLRSLSMECKKKFPPVKEVRAHDSSTPVHTHTEKHTAFTRSFHPSAAIILTHGFSRSALCVKRTLDIILKLTSVAFPGAL